jgi:hypothetical protein
MFGAIGDALSNRQGFGNFFLGKMNPQNNTASKLTDAAAKGVRDPMADREKSMAYLKAKRGEAKATAAADPNSEQSKSKAALLSGVFKKFAPYFEGKSDEQLAEIAPILSQVARGDEDRALKEMEMRMRNADRDDARKDKLDAKELKQKELSATQAKQRGLYESGKTAEGQFISATGKGDYDPTAYSEFIDNSSMAPKWAKSDNANKAQDAKNAWIESYLRDASGAAIPESERNAYASIFFPQKGDSTDAIKNKAALRAQKMDSARIAAGVETGHGPADQLAAPQTQVAGKDKQAVEWARANMADPRAKNILIQNGIDPETAVGAR